MLRIPVYLCLGGITSQNFYVQLKPNCKEEIIFRYEEWSYDIYWKMDRHRDHQGK